MHFIFFFPCGSGWGKSQKSSVIDKQRAHPVNERGLSAVLVSKSSERSITTQHVRELSLRLISLKHIRNSISPTSSEQT